ncbi:hypothetical protein BC936DRAFT_140618 [Jimgerdemannia flammicorona]|uniref:Uncharacterized protein n=2 Tax=Jimgerdemannia flammicorona TaxID=994334 RepID=A0A433Q4J7_9FUNG|nr:hypothetical protein BC936DRAFT_140618 [Jimgerdemannia flammicorona]RUS24743.1 hypothetical protein BC938DRAFT_473141 [Jimgerdemannia flammicorona]
MTGSSHSAIVKGTFVATDSENNRFRINGLQTPMGVYERAVIRGTDVDVLEIELGDDPIEGKTLKQ